MYAILDVDAAQRAGRDPFDLAVAMVQGGARLFQVRAKHLASGPFLTLCQRTVALVRPYGGFVIVNDRADLAAMAGASGVHVGQEDLTPADARAVVGIGAVIGWSTHSVDQIAASAGEPISYVAVGPVFGTASKDTGYTPVGLELVRAAAAHAEGRPVVAIGGITLDTAPAVIAAGATCVAVIGDLCAADDPEQRTAAYVRTLA